MTKIQPSGVDYDAMFVVHCNDATLADIASDGDGVFKNAGTYYWLYDKSGRCVRKKHRDGVQPTKPGFMLVAKTYYRHQFTPSLKKTIVHVQDIYSRLLNNLAMVIYRFDGKPVPVLLKPHGLAKTSRTYTRVKPSLVKSLGSTPLPRKALANHIVEHGGVGAIPKELHPRPNRVVRGASHPKSTSTQPVDWDYLLELCNNPDTVVRSLSQHPEPTILLATEQQLKDLLRFSCGDKAQPITVDPTFNLGQFYVTPVTYRNELIESRRPGACKMAQCGPVLIHYTKTKAAYLQLFQQLQANCPGIENVRAVGTDGEDNLVSALKEIFPLTTHLRCYRHFEANLITKLRSLNLSQYVGNIVEELKLLVTSEDLDAAFNDLLMTWEERSPDFSKYLQDRLHIITDSLHHTVVEQAGADGGKQFYTNASESMNHKIKSFMGGTQHNLTNFIDLLTVFFVTEVQAAESAYLGNSDTHCISKEYSGKLSNRSANDAQFLKLCNSTSLDLSLNSPHLGTRDSCDSFNSHFDILPRDCHISCHPDVLQNMYHKADRYLVDKWICKGPDTNTSDVVYFARSASSARYNQITLRLNGNTKCECPSWKANSICSHTIASSHLNGTLYSHIVWLRKKQPAKGYKAFTQRVNTDTAGLKSSTKGRKRSKTTVASPAHTAPAPCPADHTDSTIVVDMAEHRRVQRCEACKRPFEGHGLALAMKIYRPYHNKKTGKQSMTLKREWAYFHPSRSCTMAYSSSGDVHCCTRHHVALVTELSLLQANGFSVL